ncbi:hypothetical protein [Fretibacter rubidus]|uniref:hypothetical protein n=1 Tax=Fretibacter rubidus TaxID=570162 RepID=UPI00352B8B15
MKPTAHNTLVIPTGWIAFGIFYILILYKIVDHVSAIYALSKLQSYIFAGLALGLLELIAITAAILEWKRNPNDKHYKLAVHLGLLIGGLIGIWAHKILAAF